MQRGSSKITNGLVYHRCIIKIIQAQIDIYVNLHIFWYTHELILYKPYILSLSSLEASLCVGVMGVWMVRRLLVPV